MIEDRKASRGALAALARTVEDAGYAGPFRSDHLTGLFGDSGRPSLTCGLAHLARRQHAAVAVRPAGMPSRSISRRCWPSAPPPMADLGGGRLDLGIGAAGTRASTRCSASVPPLKERLDGWSAAPARSARCGRPGPVTLESRNYPLRGGAVVSAPARRRVPRSSAGAASAGRFHRGRARRRVERHPRHAGRARRPRSARPVRSRACRPGSGPPRSRPCDHPRGTPGEVGAPSRAARGARDPPAGVRP